MGKLQFFLQKYEGELGETPHEKPKRIAVQSERQRKRHIRSPPRGTCLNRFMLFRDFHLKPAPVTANRANRA